MIFSYQHKNSLPLVVTLTISNDWVKTKLEEVFYG